MRVRGLSIKYTQSAGCLVYYSEASKRELAGRRCYRVKHQPSEFMKRIYRLLATISDVSSASCSLRPLCKGITKEKTRCQPALRLRLDPGAFAPLPCFSPTVSDTSTEPFPEVS